MAPTAPSLPPDFVDLLAAFAAARVRYLVIGGYAVGYHDRPRTTKDLDLLLDPDPVNVQRACDALRTFGAADEIVAELAASREDEIVWMGVPPLRVDLLKQAAGVTFDEAWSRRITAAWSGIDVAIISLDDLVVAKRAAGRPQDRVDATNLEKARRRARGKP